MNNVLSYNSGLAQKSPLTGTVDDYWKKRLGSGGVTDAMRAKWAEMDEGTSAIGNQARIDSAQPGMFGQGRATRAIQGVNQTFAQQESANKLKQAQMAGEANDSAASGAASWTAGQDASARADRQAAMDAAEKMGDTVTMAGLNQQGLGRMGYDYTASGQTQMDTQSAQAKADAEWAKKMQEQQIGIQQAQSDNAITQANKKPSKWGRALAGAGGGAAIGTALLPGVGTAVGAGLGAIGSLFDW